MRIPAQLPRAAPERTHTAIKDRKPKFTEIIESNSTAFVPGFVFYLSENANHRVFGPNNLKEKIIVLLCMHEKGLLSFCCGVFPRFDLINEKYEIITKMKARNNFDSKPRAQVNFQLKGWICQLQKNFTTSNK